MATIYRLIDKDTSAVKGEQTVTGEGQFTESKVRNRMQSTAEVKYRDGRATLEVHKSDDDGATFRKVWEPSSPDTSPLMARIMHVDSSTVTHGPSAEVTDPDEKAKLTSRYRATAEVKTRDEDGTYTAQFSKDSGATWS